MKVLSGYEPKEVLGFFEDICGIPHISYHEQKLSDYCVNFAKERNLYYEQDELGNVIIIGEATAGYEDVEPIMIQGHLDMVGDQTPECTIDMENESICIMVDGDYITADGTTLGGDDGIAVAFGLALLDSEDIPHPRLEIVLTVSEETGLEGAAAIDLSVCKAKRLINIDSEEEGIFVAGCAGGMRADCHMTLSGEKKSGTICKVTTKGLLGGHSGVEIHKNHVNGNVMLGRFLLSLEDKIEYDIVSVVGGVKDNVIPKNATATILTDENDMEKLAQAVEEFNRTIAAEYAVTDPDVQLELSVGEGEPQTAEKSAKEVEVLDKASKEKVLTALNLLPNGVQAMSQDLPGLVETSLNMGTLQVDSHTFDASFSVRSSVASAKDYLASKLELLMKALGGSVSYHGAYPGWSYVRDSALREMCVRVFKEKYGKEPQVDVIHAGLECGLLSNKIEGLDCISMGPDMCDVHTPDEKISISSIARFWDYLKAVIAEK